MQPWIIGGLHAPTRPGTGTGQVLVFDGVGSSLDKSPSSLHPSARPGLGTPRGMSRNASQSPLNATNVAIAATKNYNLQPSPRPIVFVGSPSWEVSSA